MKIEINTREQQHSGKLFGGKLRENRPISDEAYSNLIYWAHLEAPEDGEFGMHPHQGIEILTFILEGALEHFDSASNVWTPLPADGVQHIQAGKGVHHSERYNKGSRAFQIWFDPDFSKSLKKDAYYKDYQSSEFTWEEESDHNVKIYVGNDAPIQTDAPGISAKRYRFRNGGHELEFNEDSVYSLYLLNGRIDLNGDEISKDAFVRVTGATKINFDVMENCDLFVLKSPEKVGYKLTPVQ